MRKIEESGRTLVEIILVLSIIGFIAGGVYRLISVGMDRYKLSRVSQQLVDLQKALNQRYAADDGYGNMKVASLISEKTIPSDMISNNDIKHKYEGAVKLAPALTDNKGVRITFEHLPIKACLEMITMNWIIGDNSDLYSITVGSKTYMWPNQYKMTISNKLPITVDEAGALCNPDKDDPDYDKDGVTIKWIFY